MKPITNVTLNITDECNLRCKYCFHTKSPHRMTLDTAKRAADLVWSNADKTRASVCFFGGEPMLRFEDLVMPLTEYIREKYGYTFDLSMTTNGTLLSPSVCDFISKNRISVLISADGGRDTQNNNRPIAGGAGSFDAMADGASRILSIYPDVQVRMTLTPERGAYLYDDLIELNQIGFYRMVTLPDASAADWTAEAKANTEAAVHRYSDYVIQSYRNGVIPFSLTNLVEKCRSVTAQKFIERDGMRIQPDSRCGTGCNHAAGIDYAGNIYTCHRFTTIPDSQKFIIGDVFHGVDEERRLKIEMALLEEELRGSNCNDCLLSKVCNAVCLAENYGYSGKLFEVNPIGCWWQQLITTEALYIMNTLGDEQNKLFRDSYCKCMQGDDTWQ